MARKARSECFFECCDDDVITSGEFEKRYATINEAHFGMEKCKRRAREIMYWPGMNSDVENEVSQCGICEKFKKANSKESLKPHTVPFRPFEKIGVDIMDFGDVSYLIVMDYYSKWMEIIELANKCADECSEEHSTYTSNDTVFAIICNASLLQVRPMVTSKLALTCCKLVSHLHSCRVRLAASLQICSARLLQTKIGIWVTLTSSINQMLYQPSREITVLAGQT
ncbi:hypothetical protein AVEN_158991-1 [Araneus ventricosus]|uniref:RNA-directed DNA polymerase n=1 Tax=Araneus ventricosus TaxID=182803 RepID=A0A4Y2B955_ARAVE|nr:hypothetical protein AVEN_158991-1 [Araneus ventricosus]